MYAKYIFNAEAKSQVVEMTHFLRKAFAKMLEDLEWMDAETKNEAAKKLKEMKQYIGFPDEILDPVKVDSIYKGLEMSEENYLANKLKINFYRMQYSSREFRDKIDPADWRKGLFITYLNSKMEKLSVNFGQKWVNMV